MKRGLVVLVLLVAAGCSSGKPSAAPSTTPSSAMDNYAQIACRNIDKAHTAFTAPNGTVLTDAEAIQSYTSAVTAATKSTSADFVSETTAHGSDTATIEDRQRFSDALDAWRSFCQSKGWAQ